MRALRGAAFGLLWWISAFATAQADEGAAQSSSDEPLVSEVSGLLQGDGSEFEFGGESAEPADDNDPELAALDFSTAALEAADTSCCSDGDCVCRGAAPNDNTPNRNGPFRVGSYSRGFRVRGNFGGATVYYPTDAPGPLSGVIMCPGYSARQSSIADWVRSSPHTASCWSPSTPSPRSTRCRSARGVCSMHSRR